MTVRATAEARQAVCHDNIEYRGSAAPGPQLLQTSFSVSDAKASFRAGLNDLGLARSKWEPP